MMEIIKLIGISIQPTRIIAAIPPSHIKIGGFGSLGIGRLDREGLSGLGVIGSLESHTDLTGTVIIDSIFLSTFKHLQIIY
tara:strand:- start:220 stop:462 length:243 start_codon:yes stop_codon:yes gene_type:complete